MGAAGLAAWLATCLGFCIAGLAVSERFRRHRSRGLCLLCAGAWAIALFQGACWTLKILPLAGLAPGLLVAGVIFGASGAWLLKDAGDLAVLLCGRASLEAWAVGLASCGLVACALAVNFALPLRYADELTFRLPVVLSVLAENGIPSTVLGREYALGGPLNYPALAYPKLYEMLMAAPVALGAPLWMMASAALAAACLLALACWCLAGALGAPRWLRGVSVLAASAVPTVFLLATSSYTDLLFTALVLGAAAAGVEYMRRGDGFLGVTAALFIGLCSCVKYSGLPVAVSAVAALALWHVARGEWRQLASGTTVLVVLWMAAAGPWYAQNALRFGHPLAPVEVSVLGLEVFPSLDAAVLPVDHPLITRERYEAPWRALGRTLLERPPTAGMDSATNGFGPLPLFFAATALSGAWMIAAGRLPRNRRGWRIVTPWLALALFAFLVLASNPFRWTPRYVLAPALIVLAAGVAALRWYAVPTRLATLALAGFAALVSLGTTVKWTGLAPMPPELFAAALTSREATFLTEERLPWNPATDFGEPRRLLVADPRGYHLPAVGHRDTQLVLADGAGMEAAIESADRKGCDAVYIRLPPLSATPQPPPGWELYGANNLHHEFWGGFRQTGRLEVLLVRTGAAP